jgi:DNA helicase-2/ATP-dependent DNA helicase PcrA
VLVRTHAQIPVLAEALRRMGVPHRVRGSDGLLERRDVRTGLDLLRRSRGTLAASLPDLAAVNVEPGPEDGPDGLGLVIQMAHDHLRLDPTAGAAGFAAWLVATLQAEGGDDRIDAVTVATFHAAKGLEWPIVHLAGLEDGLVPLAHARTNAQRAEEARLLYVAMTRAEDELRCTWAAQRTYAGKPADRRLSPWLAGLAEQQRAVPDTPPGPPADWRDQLAAQRARLAEHRARAVAEGPAVSPALAALRSWRDASARAARVAPPALVDDRLLEAIAARRPSTPEELAAVPGMGPVLAARVGSGLLAALHDTAPEPV